jgi:hypothetical protein
MMGFVAVLAVLRAASGAEVLTRAMVVTPFPILPRKFPFSFACAGVFSTTIALVWTRFGREAKRLRDDSSCHVHLAQRGTEIR